LKLPRQPHPRLRVPAFPRVSRLRLLAYLP
jgi:hypothetical protein